MFAAFLQGRPPRCNGVSYPIRRLGWWFYSRGSEIGAQSSRKTRRCFRSTEEPVGGQKDGEMPTVCAHRDQYSLNLRIHWGQSPGATPPFMVQGPFWSKFLCHLSFHNSLTPTVRTDQSMKR